MNRVDISCAGFDEPLWLDRFRSFAAAVLKRLDKDGWDLSVLLCDDPTIRDLNLRYREKDEATDVLSFELGERVDDEEEGERWAPGDLVISLDTLAKNAVYFGVGEDEELRRLTVHGILHLCGMDHEDNQDDRPMLLLQERLLADLSSYRIMEEPPTK